MVLSGVISSFFWHHKTQGHRSVQNSFRFWSSQRSHGFSSRPGYAIRLATFAGKLRRRRPFGRNRTPNFRRRAIRSGQSPGHRSVGESCLSPAETSSFQFRRLPHERIILGAGINGGKTFPKPTNSYGRSKLAAEQAVRASGVSFTILRPVVMYGQGEKGNFQGEKGNFSIIHKISRLPVPLPFGALTAQRSVLSVDNFSSAVVMVLSPAPCARRDVHRVRSHATHCF